MATTTVTWVIGTVAALTAAVRWWRAARRRITRAIESDPEQARLSRPLRGRSLDVRSPDGTALHVELFGPEDGQPIVLVHGWTCNLRFWTYQVHALSDRYRVIAFDLRGHGQSEPPKGDRLTPGALADDLQVVLEAAIPDGRRALLVGHSLGAMTIVAWAREYPAEVVARASAAMLINTGISELASEANVGRFLPRQLKVALVAAMLAAKLRLPRASPITHRGIKAIALSPGASPAQVAFCRKQILGCPTKVRATFGRSLARLNLEHAVEHLAVPTLVVAGSRDRLTPPSHAQRFAKQLRDMLDLVELDETGHRAPVEAPDAISAQIERLANLHAPQAS